MLMKIKYKMYVASSPVSYHYVEWPSLDLLGCQEL